MEFKLGKVSFGKASIIIGALFVCYIIGSIVYFSYLRSTIIFQETQLSRLLKTASSSGISLLDKKGNLSLSNDQFDNQVNIFISEIGAMRNEITAMRNEIKVQEERQNDKVIFDIARNSIDSDTNIGYSEYIQRRITQENMNNQDIRSENGNIRSISDDEQASVQVINNLAEVNTSITIANNTDYTIDEVYVSLTSSDSWGSNRLGTLINTLPRNNHSTVISSLLSNNRYDISLVDTDGDTYTKWNVLLKPNQNIVFTFDDID